MNFQQLRAVRETVRCGFSLTEAAQVLQASQSGVSRQIRDLEQELGIALFTRTGKRLVGLTFPGDHMLPFIERLLGSGTDLRRAGQEFLLRRHGTLTIAATHSRARYALPRAVQAFRRIFPEVRLQLHQGSPRQITQMLLDGEIDIGIASELPSDHSLPAVLPCRDWPHLVVAPQGHPLLAEAPFTIEGLAGHPLVTYDSDLTGRSRRRRLARPLVLHRRLRRASGGGSGLAVPRLAAHSCTRAWDTTLPASTSSMCRERQVVAHLLQFDPRCQRLLDVPSTRALDPAGDLIDLECQIDGHMCGKYPGFHASSCDLV